MTPKIATTLATAGALALAVAVSVPASAQALNARTAQSDLPRTGPRAAMTINRVNLSLSVNPDERSIRGEGVYLVTVDSALDQLAFDLDPRYAIDGIWIGEDALDKGAWRNPDGILEIDLPSRLAAGRSTMVRIEYSGQPHVARRAPWDGGFVWDRTRDGQPWIATAIQGEGCDMFWPCIDHSSSRIESMDTLVTVPEGLVAAGNGRLVGTAANPDGTTTYHWSARNPSNYGISLQIGPYELAESMYQSRFGNTVPIQFWHMPGNEAGAQRLVEEMESYLDFFESTVGPYPFADEKAGVAETPHLGMEHQTINAYGNRYRADPLGYDWLLHHEFAHEWFANQLKHANVNHMWLHEGIGTWMQPLYLGWANGQMYYDAEMWRQRQGIASRVPLVPPEGQLPDYNDDNSGWGGDIYAKGAWILHTLRYVVGEDVIFPALTRLTYGTDNPVPGNIAPVLRTTDDFRAILEEMSGQQLDWFFDAYFYQADLPRLESERQGNTMRLRWVTPSEMPFAMPVEIEVDGTLQTLPMADGTGTITLPDARAHVLVDPRNQILRFDEAIDRWRAGR